MFIKKKLSFKRIADFANMDSIALFSEKEVIEGLKQYSNLKYNVLTDKDDCICIQAQCDDHFARIFLDDQIVYLEGNSNDEELDFHFVMLFLYTLYKYKPYTRYQDSLIYKNRQYILDDAFTRAIVAAYGYVDYLNKNFQFLDYFNFIKYADSLDISDLDEEKQSLFYSLIFKVEIKEKNVEYIIDILSNYIHFYRRGLMMYIFIDRIFELINYSPNTYFEKIFKKLYLENCNGSSRESETSIYIYLRYTYEILNDKNIKNELLKQYENNKFIQRYFDINNLIDNKQNDDLFFKKKKYTDTDIKYIISNINKWNKEQKEHVLITILYENMDFNYFLTLKDYISDEELKDLCFNKDIKLFFNNRFMDYVMEKTEDIDVYIEYLNFMKLINFDRYFFILKNDISGIKLAKLAKFLIYVVNDYKHNFDSIYTRFVSLLELIKDLEYGYIYCHLLARYIMNNASINIIRNKLALRKYLLDDHNLETIKVKYGYDNLKTYIESYDIDDNLYDIFNKTVSLEFKYESNPNLVMVSVNFGKALLCQLIMEDDATFSKNNIFFNQEILSVILKMVYNRILSNDEQIKELNNSFALEEEKKKELLLVEKKNESKKTIDDLSLIANRLSPVIPNEKISIIPCIKIIKERNGKINKNIYFKVGVSKFYVVKSYSDFIDNIINNKVERYGKSFAFNHNINSFDEKGKALINLFIGQGILTGNERYTNLSNYNLDFILNLYDRVNIIEEDRNRIDLDSDDEEYSVNKDGLKLGLYLDDNYVLHVKHNDNIIKNAYIIKTTDKAYLFNNKTIYLLNDDKDMVDIYAYVLKNSVNVEYNKNTFIKNIYGKYVNNIEIDENIKDEFKLKDLKIEAYFDYVNDEISYYTKFYIDNELVDESVIEETPYLYSRLSSFNSIIDSFGFVNNVLKGIDKIYIFLSADLKMLNEIASIYLSENIKLVKTKTYTKSNCNLSYNAGLLDVCFDAYEYSDEDLYKIIASLKKKVNYVKLNDNSIIKIDQKDGDDLVELVEDLDLDLHHLKKTQHVPLYQSLKLANKDDFSIANISDNIKDLISDIANYKASDYLPSDAFNKVMRSYQVDAFKWIKTLIKYNFSGILADDMGLGKSLEIISVIEDDKVNQPSLIVCPKSLIFNWENEFKKWYPSIEVYPVYGNARERHNAIVNFDNKKKQIFIISYDSLKNDLDVFDTLNFRFAILDEAQFIKNHNTLKAKSVKNINSSLRFVLTGTPIENSVIDLWSIFDFLMPSYLYSYKVFSEKFERNIIEHNDNSYKVLLSKISPFILRRTKKDVLKDLPDKIEVEQVVSMGEEQRKVYEAQLLKTRLAFEESENKINLLAMITRLRQLCVDPGMFLDGYNDDSCKLEAIDDIIDNNIENHKIIIFSQFTKSFINLEKLLNSKEIRYSKITGETSAEDRMEIANDFNAGDKYQVLLISLKAGGTGLNLIGSDLVIHLDPWWNVAAMNQASDRVHRIGQKNVVNIIKLVCKDSIEQKIIELQNAKKDIVDKLIAEDDSNIRNLSNEDLKYILG